MAFQVSPGVAVSEIDASTTIPTASVSDAGFAGYFSQGPIDQVVTIGSENELVNIFGKPNSDNASDWLAISSFLAYGGSIQVVRNAPNGALNAVEAGGTAKLIKNKEEFENDSSQAFQFAARTAGDWSNNLNVVVLDSGHHISAPAFGAPKIDDTDTTTCHIFITDGAPASNGDPISDNVVESFLWLDTESGSVDGNGESNYYKNVINQKSQYVYAGDHNIALEPETDGTPPTDGFQFIDLAGGVNGTAVTKDYTLFEDTEQVDLALIVSGTNGQEKALDLAIKRKDCVAFVSPELDDVNNNSDQSTKSNNVVLYRDDLGSSSYGFMDSGWKKMYDKYNDTWVKVPLNGDTAGLCVATDNNREPWYSPAGFNRGQVRNIAGLLFDPNQVSRDTLYKSNVNPVASFPGEGYVLFGDKTLQTKPSAFDRINVRRLFIVLEKAIANAAKYSLFEFNDEFTRGQFISMVDPFLRNIKGRRGIQDYLVVCDESNNTADIIDRNEFIGDIFIKPSRSINFIQLNFVAVSTGVSFSEVVGAV